MIESKIGERLATVTTNVHSIVAPAGVTFPVLIFNRTSTEEVRSFDEEDFTQAFVTMQIDIYALNMKSVVSLAKKAIKRLRSWDDEAIQCVEVEEQQTSADNTGDVPLYRIMTFVRFFVTEGD